MKGRYDFPLDEEPDALCSKCGHRADEHHQLLPSPCLHGRTDPLCIWRDHPSYGCKCIAFSPQRSKP